MTVMNFSSRPIQVITDDIKISAIDASVRSRPQGPTPNYATSRNQNQRMAPRFALPRPPLLAGAAMSHAATPLDKRMKFHTRWMRVSGCHVTGLRTPQYHAVSFLVRGRQGRILTLPAMFPFAREI